MALQRLCKCGNLFDATRGRYRCEGCAKAHEAARDARRGSPAERGYDKTYRANRKAVLEGATVCVLCNKPFSSKNRATTDHVVPLAKGGSSDATNLRAVCQRCNSARGDKTNWRPHEDLGRA